ETPRPSLIRGRIPDGISSESRPTKVTLAIRPNTNHCGARSGAAGTGVVEASGMPPRPVCAGGTDGCRTAARQRREERNPDAHADILPPITMCRDRRVATVHTGGLDPHARTRPLRG